MATFPEIYPDYGYQAIPQFRTLKLGPTDGDFIQRRRKRTSPLYKFVLKYKVLEESEMQSLWDFYLARSGSYEAFVFFDFQAFPYTGVSVGTGDGTTADFDLGAKSVSNLTVYLNGSPTSAYTLNVGGGTDGQDSITFNSAPANGDVITADYTGRKYFPKCIFQDDELARESFSYLLYTTGLVILEVSS